MIEKPFIVGRIVIAAAIFLGFSTRALSQSAAEQPAHLTAAAQSVDRITADAAMDRLFTRTGGWTGGDVAGSVDLRDGRVLWLFGDTWIGRVANNEHVSGIPMVHNTSAIQSLHGAAAANTDSPAASEIHFYWNNRAKEPHAWLVPTGSDAEKNPKAPDSTVADWFWPTGGGIIVPAAAGRRQLVIFLRHVGKRSSSDGPFTAWAFRDLGSTMATVANADQPVEKWDVRQFDVPFWHAAPTPQATAARHHRANEIIWGAAIVQASAGESGADDWLSIYGVRRQSFLGMELLVARARPSAIASFDSWQFYSGHGTWSSHASDAAPIANGLSPELSIDRLPSSSDAKSPRRPKWIMVYSEPALGRKIFVRMADRPEGPWSERKEVYSVSEVDRDPTYYAYAAKGHVELSRPGELLVSYVVNSRDFGPMAHDVSIYRPRFIRVPLDMFIERTTPHP